MFGKAGKYGEAKESKSRWTDEAYNVIGISEDFNTTYRLEGKAKLT